MVLELIEKRKADRKVFVSYGGLKSLVVCSRGLWNLNYNFNARVSVINSIMGTQKAEYHDSDTLILKHYDK